MPRKKNQLTVIGPSMMESVFGPVPVLDNEDSQAYEALLESVFAAVQPVGCHRADVDAGGR
jgi:hypothetical protein